MLFRFLVPPLIVLLCFPSLAAVVTESFTSSSSIDTANSTLVLNHALGRLHPPFFIEGIERNPGDPLENPSFSLGNGADGDFIRANYEKFSLNGDVSGQIIRLNVSELKVKSFVLEAGWTLMPLLDAPLVIRSLSNIKVDGTILCSGANGEDGTAGMTAAAAGGAGRCGGGSGGRGGGTVGVPVAGSAPTDVGVSGVTGGLVAPASGFCWDGAAAAAGRCGGGGGAFSEGGTGGVPVATAGVSVSDKTFTFRAGGAGGAGGFSTGSGGGGGGGGGFIDLFAGSGIEVTGSVLARGGVGGASDADGAGGGGGGGTIMMAAGGAIVFQAGSLVSAEGALGGTTNVVGTRGGQGWIGRTFIVALNSVGPECLSQGVPEVPDRHVSSVGCVRYQTGTFTALSSVFDLYNSKPELRVVTPTASLTAGSTLDTSIATSRDGFVGHDSGLSAWTGISKTLDRYVRFNLSLNNQDSINGASVDQIQLEYEQGLQTEFEFRSGCAGVGFVGGAGKFPLRSFFGSLILLSLPFFVMLLLRRRV